MFACLFAAYVALAQPSTLNPKTPNPLSQALHDRCREAGMEAFLTKPFRIEDLKRVMRLVAAARASQAAVMNTGASTGTATAGTTSSVSAAAASGPTGAAGTVVG